MQPAAALVQHAPLLHPAARPHLAHVLLGSCLRSSQLFLGGQRGQALDTPEGGQSGWGPKGLGHLQAANAESPAQQLPAVPPTSSRWLGWRWRPVAAQVAAAPADQPLPTHPHIHSSERHSELLVTGERLQHIDASLLWHGHRHLPSGGLRACFRHAARALGRSAGGGVEVEVASRGAWGVGAFLATNAGATAGEKSAVFPGLLSTASIILPSIVPRVAGPSVTTGVGGDVIKLAGNITASNAAELPQQRASFDQGRGCACSLL